MSESHPTPPPEHEVLLRTITDPDQLNTSSLVLSAKKITHRIQWFDQHHFRIYVHPDQFASADRELLLYEQENRDWPPVEKDDDFAPSFKAMSPTLMAILVYIYLQTGQWRYNGPWFAQGCGDSGAILDHGEYFRLITALTLHADAVHLLGNTILGGFLIHFFLQLTGNGIGLAAILVTGTIANYLNVLAHGPGHLFVGFSTAVFSVIGMLCTINYATSGKKAVYKTVMPIMAGLALLALVGSGGERTDLGAHFFGLVTGLIGGNVVRLKSFDVWRRSTPLQLFLSLLFFFCIYGSWQLAFGNTTF
ncbi:rhomboid family intramembrane serine protease [Desulforhopalus singaporensis]|uniref:Membrane associated serine protease, rhomboid family n=1 Tax=Desulforhopalus singaporensis TaxID=91360 RepID=A0A1H0R7W8_9BACT|nr:rhomboid family intramembrane serine protease [Desulforhopalus singaporensis]SDP25594.1 Membrane associated serine protease, rhomboid family [Desulforhopalus singaporensis]